MFAFLVKKTSGILFFGPNIQWPKYNIPEVFLTRKAKKKYLKLYTYLVLEEKIGINMGLLLAKCYLLSDKPWDALELLKHMGTTFLPQPLGSHGSVVSSSPVHTPTHQLRYVIIIIRINNYLIMRINN